jgi:hypothetical protein
MLDQGSDHCICQDHERSIPDRPGLFVPIAGVMFASAFGAYALGDFRYGSEISSLISYTAFVALGTFSVYFDQQPYFFECPIVRRNLLRLAWLHGVFLVALVVLEMVALKLRPHLPVFWVDPPSWFVAIGEGGDASPFTMTLLLLCVFLGVVQIVSNRALLDLAHPELSEPVPLDPSNPPRYKPLQSEHWGRGSGAHSD